VEPMPVEPTKLGQRWAWRIFGLAVVVQVLALIYAFSERSGYGLIILLPVDMGTAILGLIVGGVVSWRLPQPARKAFWATGSLCMGLTLALFGVGCGISLLSLR